jgi:hypothetical protein
LSYDNPPPPPPPQYGAPVPGAVPGGTNKKAIWSLVLGILGLLCCGFIAGVPAIILANMAKKEIPARGEGGNGLATAGLVLGIIAVVWSVINLILALSGNGIYDFEFNSN